MKKTTKIILAFGLSLAIASSLLYFVFPGEIFFDQQDYFCAVCNCRLQSKEYFILSWSIFKINSKPFDSDPFYETYIKEPHTHLWIDENCCQRFFINGQIAIIDKMKLVDQGPGFYEATIYNSALKLAKIRVKAGEITNVIEKYYEDIKELMKISNEQDLKFKNIEISERLRRL